MSHISHVLFAGSLLLSQIDQNVSAQTIPSGTPGDKATIASLSVQSRVQDTMGTKTNAPLPLGTFSTETIVRNNDSLSRNDAAYNAAVAEVQTKIAGRLSFEMGDSGTRMWLGNNPSGGAAVIITNNISLDGRGAKGKWEAAMTDKWASVSVKITF